MSLYNYALLLAGTVVGHVTESPYDYSIRKFKEFPGIAYDSVVNLAGSDITSFDQAEVIAAQLATLTKEPWIAFDNGRHTSHQFGAMILPKVGDNVSYAFNGDYYPCGKIVRITKGLRIIAEGPEGQKKFNRSKNTSKWLMVGGTWALVKGVHNDKNPEF